MSNRNYTQGNNFNIVNYPHNEYNMQMDDVPHINQSSPPPSHSALSGNREFLRTGHTVYNRSVLIPDRPSSAARAEEPDDHVEWGQEDEDGIFDMRGLTDTLPTDIGAKIGVLYTRNDGKFDIYLVVNGCEVGPLVKDIPMRTGSLWPILDIYGTTNQVQIVQLPINDSLLSMCREVIVQYLLRLEDIDKLCIPDRLKNYLQFKEN